MRLFSGDGCGPRRHVALVGLLALLLTCACADTPAARPHDIEPQASGGVLRMLQEAPASLDPIASESVYESLPVNQIFDGLVTLDASLNVVPSLAESWTISRDGRVYLFELRDGVRFHHGRVLVADDVVFTIRRLLRDPDNLAASYVEIIQGASAFRDGETEQTPGVTAPEPGRVRIALERPYPAFLEVLAMDNLAVVPRDLLGDGSAAEFARKPVGTGPFRLAEWGAESLRLVANPDYFRGPPHLDGVEIAFLRADEEDYGTARFFSRELDLFDPPTESLNRLGAEPGVRVQRFQELSLSFLGLNTRVAPLDRKWFRQAIAHALDRDALVRESPEVRREAVGILPPGILGYTPEPKALAHDPALARDLLARNGYPGGSGLSPLRLYNPSSGKSVQNVIRQLQRDLEAVGIRLEVVPITWPELGRRLDDGTIEAFLLGWIADLTDPDAFLSIFGTEGPGNYFGLRDATIDRRIAEAAAESNPVERRRLYRDLEREILEHAPMVPLYHTLGTLAIREEVRGVNPGPMGLARLELERVWFRREGGGA